VEVDGEEGLPQVEGTVLLLTQCQREPEWDECYESNGLDEASPCHWSPPGASVELVVDLVELLVVGCLQAQAAAWAQIGASNQVCSWVTHGVAFELWTDVVEDQHIFPLTPAQQAWLLAEVDHLLTMGAVELMGTGPSKPASIHYMSLVFCMPKNGPKKWRLVIDMCCINLGIAEWRVQFKGCCWWPEWLGEGGG
jgi:hypothetical protein